MLRRDFIKSLAGGLVLMNAPTCVLAASKEQTTKRFVLVILRGAMDGLHTVIPAFDKNYQTLRPTLSSQVKQNSLPLTQGYRLNPALKNLHQWYQNGHLMPIVATATPYRARSHFDGQDFLESGKPKVDLDSGWLARAIQQQSYSAIGISQSTPISLRGTSKATTWYPSNLKDADEDIYQTLMKMYQDDTKLMTSLQEGLNLKDTAMLPESGKNKANFITLASACANLLAENNEMNCAMLEMGGWDTHNNQHMRLDRQLSQLDEGLAVLRQGLGDKWQHTLVAVVTEFGRTAKENGTGGTDHGTASTLFFAGGAVKGGKVVGDWPGLAKEQLFEQRDLMPTSNTFSWLATALTQHWDLSVDEVKQVFPGIGVYTQPIV
jgi:uncharacterized protein (DUF1501 family)